MIEDVMRAILQNEFASALGSARRKNRESSRSRQLNCRRSDSAARAMNQNSFACDRFGALKQSTISSGVRRVDRRTLSERNFFRQRMNIIRFAQREFCISASRSPGSVNTISDTSGFYFRADGFNHTRRIFSWRVGQRWETRIRPGANVSFDRIHSGSMNAHKNLFRAGLRNRNFFKPQNFRPAELMDVNGFHILNFERSGSFALPNQDRAALPSGLLILESSVSLSSQNRAVFLVQLAAPAHAN